MRARRVGLAAWFAVAALTVTSATAADAAGTDTTGSSQAPGVVATTGASSAHGAEAPCRRSSGVTVVVDYARGGGGIDVRCAPGDPTSGLAALSLAGLPYAFVPRQPGLVCTINSVPDPCNGAPATAYWSYWHLRPDRTWEFSSVGAGGYDPAPGEVEGWAFGAGQPPRVPRP